MDKTIILGLMRALDLITKGLSEVHVLLEDLDKNSKTAASVPETSTDHEESGEYINPPEEETAAGVPEESTDGDSAYTQEYLTGLKFNDLKKLGASLGVKCTGTRNEIIERILAHGEGSEGMEGKSSSNVVNMPEPKNSGNKPLKKNHPLKKAGEDEIEEKYIEQAGILLEEYSVKDIVDVLKDSGVSVSVSDKKDKDKILQILAKAIKDGYVEVEEDDSDEESTGTEDSAATKDRYSEFYDDSYFPEFDPEGYNDPSKMTEARKAAVKEVVTNLINAREDGELTEDAMTDELSDFGFLEDADGTSGNELFARYIEVQKRFISDEGEEMNPGDAYELNDTYFCCGSPLVYDKKQKNYTCAVCGEVYEV